MPLHPPPDIYVVPPAEDQAAPWCCHNSHSPISNDDDDEQSLRFIQVSHRTPYFHRTMPGSGALILPSRKPSGDTQSIVDALGDADDFSDDEFDHGPMHVVPEEDEDQDHSGYEMGVPNESYSSPEPYPEVGNDSDIIEVFKVRRRSMRAAHTYDNYHGTFGSPTEFNKSSLRFRATKAFRSLRGAVRPSPTLPNTRDSGNTIAPSTTVLTSASKPRPKLKLKAKPRAQEVFNPIDSDVPQAEKMDTNQLSSRPSSRLAQILPPKLRQRPSNISFTTTPRETSAQSASNITTKPLPAVPPVFHREPIPSFAPLQHPLSSRRTRQASGSYLTDTSHSKQNSRTGSRSFSAPTASQAHLRSLSHQPVSRSTSPVPSISQSSGRFSIRRLQRVFRKPSFSSISSDHRPRVDQASTIGSAHSTCPSLSSTHSSECSGRTSPTVPQTPTSFDENDTRRTIVPLPSSSSVGSGIHPGSSFNSGAVSSLSSSNTTSSMSTAATCGSAFSAPVFHPRNASRSQTSSQASLASMSSFVSVSDDTFKFSNGVAKRAETKHVPILPSAPTSPFPELKLADLDLQLGRGIDLFSNGADARPGDSKHTRHRTITSISQTLSLKSLSSRLRKGRGPMPSSSSTESDMSTEMKLNSLHFDDISFDVDRFMAP